MINNKLGFRTRLRRGSTRASRTNVIVTNCPIVGVNTNNEPNEPIASYLSHGETTGPKTKDPKQVREHEESLLVGFVSENNLWINDIDFSQYVSEGAEQRVYLKDADHVIKLNDAIYYNSQKYYFYILLFHNFFYTDTAYELIGCLLIIGVDTNN